jgi:uncharacterized protein
MTDLYGSTQRAFQDQFDTRRLADRVGQIIIHPEICDIDRDFIESRDMFWLATVDHEGRPTVSYKGGAPGFVRVLDAGTLAFPRMTATACSIRWATSRRRPRSACCS